MNPYRFIIARLNGIDIERDFDHHLRLVRKGIAGFIIFGGELETVRQGIKELQREATEPLIIASDLEQGLGGQIKGGTLFPPAMAIASAIKERSTFNVQRSTLKLLKDTFKAIALEARYAGINTIFAPVLDINTNPENPIISTRAFGEDPETVSFFGCEMIKILQAHGIAACGKHFPGHGDTEVDSHISLPVVKKDLPSLEKSELVPFKKAIDAGVKMIMLGHLSVPAIDPSGIPASLSEKTVTFLREKMSFRGITITDALNMGALGKYAEEEASLMALRAGVDILLHPTDPDKIASYLEFIESKGRGSWGKGQGKNKPDPGYLTLDTISAPCPLPVTRRCNFEEHRNISEELTRKAIKIKGSIKQIRRP